MVANLRKIFSILPLLFGASLLMGQTVHNFSIFGDDYARIVVKDQALSGQVYYIVAGHGGPDPGAVGSFDGCEICEDEYAYDIALRLGRDLIEHDAKVYIIIRDKNDGIRDESILKCDKDEVCWGGKTIPRSQSSRLYQRTNDINALYNSNKASGHADQTTIVLHVDSRGAGEKVDMFFYHKKGNVAGRELATALLTTIKNKYAQFQKGRGYTGSVESRDLHMLRETKPTTVYIELGNMQNWRDLKRFTIVDNRQAVANWLAEGIIKKKGKYVAPKPKPVIEEPVLPEPVPEEIKEEMVVENPTDLPEQSSTPAAGEASPEKVDSKPNLEK